MHHKSKIKHILQGVELPKCEKEWMKYFTQGRSPETLIKNLDFQSFCEYYATHFNWLHQLNLADGAIIDDHFVMMFLGKIFTFHYWEYDAPQSIKDVAKEIMELKRLRRGIL